MEAVRLTNDVDERSEWQNSAGPDLAFVRIVEILEILDGRARERGLSSSF
jgi:hypothetical protein